MFTKITRKLDIITIRWYKITYLKALKYNDFISAYHHHHQSIYYPNNAATQILFLHSRSNPTMDCTFRDLSLLLYSCALRPTSSLLKWSILLAKVHTIDPNWGLQIMWLTLGKDWGASLKLATHWKHFFFFYNSLRTRFFARIEFLRILRNTFLSK